MKTHGRQRCRTPCWSPRAGGRRRDARPLRRGPGGAGVARGAGTNPEIRCRARLSWRRQQCRGERARLWRGGDPGGAHRHRRRGGRACRAVPRLPAPFRTADRRCQPADHRQDALFERLAPAPVHRCGRHAAGGGPSARPPDRSGTRCARRLRRAGDIRLRPRGARRDVDRHAHRRGACGRQASGGRPAPHRCIDLCRRQRGDAQYRGDDRLFRHSRRQR